MDSYIGIMENVWIGFFHGSNVCSYHIFMQIITWYERILDYYFIMVIELSGVQFGLKS